jgi:UPF0042 nucleotide-binding protein
MTGNSTPDSISERPRVLLVTGMSGAGKSTALKALEDLGYEAVDNMPLRLLKRLLKFKDREEGDDRPLAVGIDTRTRSFDAQDVVDQIVEINRARHVEARVLFLDCSGEELTRRFSETRRRHPLAQDRPAADGIARERELLSPLRRAADILLDTTDLSVHDLRRHVTTKFTPPRSTTRLVVTFMSFGFARGIPRNTDLVFDMRFLRNPHWVDDLRQLTGRDEAVGDYIAEDPVFGETFGRIADLLETLLPAYEREGKSYLTVAFGCTGGRHRSVYVTERMAARLRESGFDPAIAHRDLGSVTPAGESAQAERESVKA